MKYIHKTIYYTDNAEVLATDLMYTYIKTEIMLVYVHLYNTVKIISPPFLKTFMHVDQLTNLST